MKYTILLLTAIFFLAGCGSDDSGDGAVSGVHFQGRDCLSCHVKDLAPSSHLSLGGTVYAKSTSDANNLNEACSEVLHVEFLVGTVLRFSTRDVNNLGDPGFNGRGNVFALEDALPINAGLYQMRIVTDAGVERAISGGDLHAFSADGFNLADPTDVANRHSCNACHQAPPNNKGGAPGLLFGNTSTCN